MNLEIFALETCISVLNLRRVSREEEQQKDAKLDPTGDVRKIDCTDHAGDVFDVWNPPPECPNNVL